MEKIGKSEEGCLLSLEDIKLIVEKHGNIFPGYRGVYDFEGNLLDIEKCDDESILDDIFSKCDGECVCKPAVVNKKKNKGNGMENKSKSGYEIRWEILRETLDIAKEQWREKLSLLQLCAKDNIEKFKHIENFPSEDAIKLANKLYTEFVEKK